MESVPVAAVSVPPLPQLLTLSDEADIKDTEMKQDL